MCSGGFIPEHTFSGEKLETLGTSLRRPSQTSVSSFGDEMRGFVAFAWLHDGLDYCVRFINSLQDLPNTHLTGPLLRFSLSTAKMCTSTGPADRHSAGCVPDAADRERGRCEKSPRMIARQIHERAGLPAIHCLIEPKGCSTDSRRRSMTSGRAARRSAIRSRIASFR